MKRMSESEFIDQAPSYNGTVRGNHENAECSGGRDSMIVERTDDYIRAYCFRCGSRGYSGLVRHFKARTGSTGGAVGISDSPSSGYGRQPRSVPPSDATTEGSAWPREPRDWLRRGGITAVQAEDLGIQWSDSKSQLWLPVKQDKVIKGWVVRRFNPKFVRHETEHPEKFWGFIPNSASKRLVLVEDWVSAIRVSKFCPVIALMGTELKADCLRWLAEHSSMFDEVVIFLDADNTTVRMKTRTIAKRISFLRTRTIETGGDPKHLSDEELEDILCV